MALLPAPVGPTQLLLLLSPGSFSLGCISLADPLELGSWLDECRGHFSPSLRLLTGLFACPFPSVSVGSFRGLAQEALRSPPQLLASGATSSPG